MERENGKGKHQSVVASCLRPTCDLAHNPACALIGNWTSDPLVCRPVLNPLSHTSQDRVGSFWSLWGKMCSMPLSQLPVTCWQSLVFFGLYMHHSNLPLCSHHLLCSASVCPFLSPLKIGFFGSLTRPDPVCSYLTFYSKYTKKEPISQIRAYYEVLGGNELRENTIQFITNNEQK